MYFAQTIGLLLALTVAIVILRSYWRRIPPETERILLWTAATVVAVRVAFAATQWGTMSPHFDALVCWAAVAGYELMLVRFSLMRPRWLTSASAFVLLLPIFGSSFLFPLTGLFHTGPVDIRPIGNNYAVERSPWDVSASGHAGVDLGIFYRPPLAPFLRHMVQRSSFSDEQCNTEAVTVGVEPANKLVHISCPGREGQDAINLTLPLR